MADAAAVHAFMASRARAPSEGAEGKASDCEGYDEDDNEALEHVRAERLERREAERGTSLQAHAPLQAHDLSLPLLISNV